MSTSLFRALLSALLMGLLPPAQAVTGVSPFGVNVRASGPSTVFLTFLALDPGEQPAEAFWCGELRPDLMAANPQLQQPVAVQASNPCVPGSIYGRLPAALDRARRSGNGPIANLTDIMSIPASVARRAYQDAQAGLHSAFFYVRRFTGPAGDRWVVVTCRMGGGGARTPLALVEARIAFDDDPRQSAVRIVERGQPLPPAHALLRYNGSGWLRGRWELVQPGDPEPGDDDRVSEATLPVEQRVRQRRWTLLQRFELLAPATGELRIPGPDPARLPPLPDGPYQLLLRLEAADDKESASAVGGGLNAVAGGAAGFGLPALRWHVGPAAGRTAAIGEAVLLPSPPDDPWTLAWLPAAGAALQRLQLRADREIAWTAYVAADAGRYRPPPWFVDARQGQALQWQVQALDAGGEPRSRTRWQPLAVR